MATFVVWIVFDSFFEVGLAWTFLDLSKEIPKFGHFLSLFMRKTPASEMKAGVFLHEGGFRNMTYRIKIRFRPLCCIRK